MASTIAAVTTSGGGVVTTADASGNLNLLAGTTTVVALTTAGAAVTGTLSATGLISGSLDQVTGFKSRIINGAMVIDQRNAGASVTPTDGQYVLDRFKFRLAQTSKLTVQQNAAAVTPPAGFLNYLGVTSTSSYAVLAGDFFIFVQDIEGFNTSDLGFGTASASTVTLSFRVYSSLTGTFSGSLRNSAANRSYPFNYSVSTANTWTTISVTISGDTSGTWIGATNGIGLSVIFNLGCGSTFSSTANSWQTGNYTAVTGSVSVVGTNGATFYITGVQLEKGATATSFDYRPYGTELAVLCKRYYCTSSGGVGSNQNDATDFYGGFPLSPPMRAAPTLTLISGTNAVTRPGVASYNVSAVAVSQVTTTSCRFKYTVANMGQTSAPAIYDSGVFSLSSEL